MTTSVYHPYACTECTLHRCDKENQQCEECKVRLAAGANAGLAASELEAARAHVATISMAQRSDMRNKATRLGEYLKISAFPWKGTTQGYAFWQKVYDELIKIGEGRDLI